MLHFSNYFPQNFHFFDFQISTELFDIEKIDLSHQTYTKRISLIIKLIDTKFTSNIWPFSIPTLIRLSFFSHFLIIPYWLFQIFQERYPHGPQILYGYQKVLSWYIWMYHWFWLILSSLPTMNFSFTNLYLQVNVTYLAKPILDQCLPNWKSKWKLCILICFVVISDFLTRYLSWSNRGAKC
jgi:hypothetical protein